MVCYFSVEAVVHHYVYDINSLREQMIKLTSVCKSHGIGVTLKPHLVISCVMCVMLFKSSQTTSSAFHLCGGYLSRYLSFSLLDLSNTSLRQVRDCSCKSAYVCTNCLSDPAKIVTKGFDECEMSLG